MSSGGDGLKLSGVMACLHVSLYMAIVKSLLAGA